jgi:V8-like Glu-specific endopeptidase
VNVLKKSVYFIARGRKSNNENTINWTSLGTGCVVAPNRMITAAHVINNTDSQNESLQHEDGDEYYLIRNDDEGNWHYRHQKLKLDSEIFLYPKVDLAVIYLDEGFYSADGKVFAQKDDFIRVDKKFRNIATQIGVLGYPLCELTFDNNRTDSPKVGNVLLRADIGVINCRYNDTQKLQFYEFTVNFNPGNSGGPIFDLRTGQLLSIVHGYRAKAINKKEVLLSEENKKNLDIKTYTQDAYIEVIHASYSIGYATPSFNKIFEEHNI